MLIFLIDAPNFSLNFSSFQINPFSFINYFNIYFHHAYLLIKCSKLLGQICIICKLAGGHFTDLNYMKSTY